MTAVTELFMHMYKQQHTAVWNIRHVFYFAYIHHAFIQYTLYAWCSVFLDVSNRSMLLCLFMLHHV